MLDTKVTNLINNQINKELYSAYLYLHYSSYYVELGLEGYANWFMIQAQEERDHGMLFVKYLQNNNAKVTYEAIEKPEELFTSPEDPLKGALEHEQYVTRLIHTIYDTAYEIKDFRTMQFLDWFVKEQGEEEMNTENLIKKFELFGHDSKGLYMLDAEMAARVYTPASLVI